MLTPGQRIIRRIMHLWFWASRGMTLGVRIMALDGAGRVFLVRHSYLPGWHLPGGGVEPGQTLEEAALMELREEGNVVPEAALEMRGMCFNRLASRRDHVAVFLVKNARQTMPHVPNREIVEAAFFPLDALPEGVTPATLRRLNEMLEGRAPDAYW